MARVVIPEKVRTRESEDLKRLYAEKAGGLTHGEFGQRHKIGSAGMVWQYLNNHRPLGLTVARKFSAGLGVPIDAFSLRLSDEARQSAEATAGAPLSVREPEVPAVKWPFNLVTSEQYFSLKKSERDAVEGLALRFVTERKVHHPKSKAA